MVSFTEVDYQNVYARWLDPVSIVTGGDAIEAGVWRDYLYPSVRVTSLMRRSPPVNR